MGAATRVNGSIDGTSWGLDSVGLRVRRRPRVGGGYAEEATGVVVGAQQQFDPLAQLDVRATGLV